MVKKIYVSITEFRNHAGSIFKKLTFSQELYLTRRGKPQYLIKLIR